MVKIVTAVVREVMSVGDSGDLHYTASLNYGTFCNGYGNDTCWF